MNALRLLPAIILLVSGCSSPTTENPGQQDQSAEAFPPTIDWFQDPSLDGAPGNRLTLAVDRHVIALDEEPSPWKIHVVYGPLLENRTSLLPEGEPLNLVATHGPRGPLVAYVTATSGIRSDVHVAEWNGVAWTNSRLAFGAQSIVGFPAFASSREELVLGFTVTTATTNYVVIRLTDGLPTDLATAQRVDLPAAPIAPGDVALHNFTIAVAVGGYDSVELRVARWEDLASALPVTLNGPPGALAQSLYPELAFDSQGGLFAAITGVDLVATGAAQRTALLYDVQSRAAIPLATRDLVEIFATPFGLAVYTQFSGLGHRVGILEGGSVIEKVAVECQYFELTPETGIVVLMTHLERRWTSLLSSLESTPPNCD